MADPANLRLSSNAKLICAVPSALPVRTSQKQEATKDHPRAQWIYVYRFRYVCIWQCVAYKQFLREWASGLL